MRKYKIPKNETTSPTEKALKVLAILLVLFATFVVMVYATALWITQPPEVSQAVARTVSEAVVDLSVDQAPSETPAVTSGETIYLPAPLPVEEQDRRRDVFSVLITGEDDGFGGPDVIMVALFDQPRGTLDILSIPRDTVVNVPWGLRKINSIQHLHHLLPVQHPHYIYAMQSEVAKLIGYYTDFWVTLDLDGFIELVDAVGGVTFDVPQRMSYRDPYQNLHIDLHPGEQHLDGYRAMQLVRYRRYADGDIQRNRVQHAFLGALSEQMLRASTLFAVDELARVFRDNVETNMNLRTLAFFGYELLRLSPENIRFHAVDRSIANISDSVNRISYVTLFPEPWVALINAYMNPFMQDIRVEQLEILTRNQDGAFFTTNGAPFSNNWAR